MFKAHVILLLHNFYLIAQKKKVLKKSVIKIGFILTSICMIRTVALNMCPSMFIVFADEISDDPVVERALKLMGSNEIREAKKKIITTDTDYFFIIWYVGYLWLYYFRVKLSDQTILELSYIFLTEKQLNDIVKAAKEHYPGYSKN